jgi:hypothetical protein
MTRAFVMAAVAVLVTASVARAEMPDYDVKKHCQRVASFTGTPSQSLLQSCFELEQTAYDHLKPTWESLPAAMKSHCDRVAKFAGDGSFSLLESCIDQEQQAKKGNEQFQFKR